MSPDASVHEEQLEEIEEQRELRKRGQRQRRKDKRKSCCCAMGCMLPVLFLLAAGAYYFLYGNFGEGPLDLSFLRGEDGLAPASEMKEAESLGDWIKFARAKAQGFQENMQEMQESGVLEQRLEALREDMRDRSELASSTLRTQLEMALEQVDTIQDKVREKGQAVPEELERLKQLLEQVDKTERTTATETNTTEESRPGEM
ncbi:MAG: hypothetical protein ACOC29_02465 [Candidatus Sumerlaeota bacterium]